MGAGRGYRLHYHGYSRVHRARPERKVAALVGFTLLVVATPREWVGAFAAYAIILLAVIRVSRVPFGYLARRLVIEIPFVLFALMMPFVAEGTPTTVLGMSVSGAGLLAAWGLVVKGTLGVGGSLTLAATTEPNEVLSGLRRLRMPPSIVQIMGFMIRYLEVVTAELSRMLIAMRSRGCNPRSPRHWPALARCLGALFVRSYERGERVHLAMLARGYDGSLPRAPAETVR
ncbi:MAG: cobalt ECF transporter T component CbiQ [Nocardioides sp.]